MSYWQIRRDFVSLFRRDDDTKGYFDPIDGLRAIANLSIILCHLITIFGAFVPSYPHVQWHEFINSQAFILTSLTILALEIFFLLSAFLLTHKLITQWAKDSKSYGLFLSRFPQSILKRALRFWPGIFLATLIMFFCGEWRHINPINYLVSVWLFFQNYVDSSYWLITIAPLWTISLDMQVHILLPLILYALHSCGKHGFIFKSLVILLLLSVIRSIFIFDPTTMPIISILSRHHSLATLISQHTCLWIQSNYNLTFPFECQTSNLLKTFTQKMYFPLDARYGSFIVGAMLALKLTTGNSYEYSRSNTVKKYIYLCSAFAYVLLIATQKIDSMTMSDLGLQISIAISRQLFAISHAFILFTVICPPSHPYHAPWIRKFLSSSIWIPISKLSYLVYIIHWPISLELIFRGPLLFLNNYSVIVASVLSLPVILLISQIFSCVWFLLIEKPFERVVQKYFDTNSKSNKSHSN